MLKSIINLNKKKNSIGSILLINLTLAFFPISFIFGNLIVNLNLILFCILGIFHLRSKILTTKYNNRFKIILVPNITNISYGRGVGYKIEEVVLPEEVQKISATKIRDKMRKQGKLK